MNSTERWDQAIRDAVSAAQLAAEALPDTWKGYPQFHNRTVDVQAVREAVSFACASLRRARKVRPHVRVETLASVWRLQVVAVMKVVSNDPLWHDNDEATYTLMLAERLGWVHQASATQCEWTDRGIDVCFPVSSTEST